MTSPFAVFPRITPGGVHPQVRRARLGAAATALAVAGTTPLTGCGQTSPPPAVSAASLTARDCRISLMEKRPGVQTVRRGGTTVIDAVVWPDAGVQDTRAVRHPGATWTLVKLHLQCRTSIDDPTSLVDPVLEGPERTSGYAEFDLPASAQAQGQPVDHDQWLLARVLPGSSLTGFRNTAGDVVHLAGVPTVGGPARLVELPWVDR